MTDTAERTTVEFPDITAALQIAQRTIANARLAAFEDACFVLGELINEDAYRRRQIVDRLQDVADANGLTAAHGDGLIHMMIAAGVRGAA